MITTDTQQQKQDGGNTSNPTTLTEANLTPTNNWTCKKKLHRQSCEGQQHKQGGKASTRPTNSGGKVSAPRELNQRRQRQSIRSSSTAAKHLPKDDQRDLDDVEETK